MEKVRRSAAQPFSLAGHVVRAGGAKRGPLLAPSPRAQLSEVCVEFPVVHPGWVGRRGARWTWGALLNDPAHQQPPRHLGKPLGAPQQSAMASLAAACSLVEELARAMDGAGPGAPGPATSPDALLQLLLEPTLVHPATDAEAARSVSSGLAMVVAARLHVTRQVASGSAVSLEGQLGALADVVHAHKPKVGCPAVCAGAASEGAPLPHLRLCVGGAAARVAVCLPPCRAARRAPPSSGSSSTQAPPRPRSCRKRRGCSWRRAP